jgi:stearoyl-CoA desaturase (delta-9 desaturase)
VPLLALVAAVPFAWGWGLGWVDIGLAAFFCTLTCLGVTVGFHRYFTHGAFKARRGLRIALAVVGSMAMQGPVIGWVADHRLVGQLDLPHDRRPSVRGAGQVGELLAACHRVHG